MVHTIILAVMLNACCSITYLKSVVLFMSQQVNAHPIDTKHSIANVRPRAIASPIALLR